MSAMGPEAALLAARLAEIRAVHAGPARPRRRRADLYAAAADRTGPERAARRAGLWGLFMGRARADGKAAEGDPRVAAAAAGPVGDRDVPLALLPAGREHPR